MPVRLRVAAALVLLLPLTLSGCGVTPYVRVFTNRAPQASLTVAGSYYLNAICPRNGAVYAYDAVRKSTDLAVLHRAAAAARAASATAAMQLRAADAPWPAAIRPQVELLAESLDFDVTSYGQLEQADTLQAARAVRWPGDTSAGDARLVIRRAVGLSDGMQYDDCVGHYGAVVARSGDSST